MLEEMAEPVYDVTGIQPVRDANLVSCISNGNETDSFSHWEIQESMGFSTWSLTAATVTQTDARTELTRMISR